MVQGVRIKDHWSEQRIFDQRVLVAGVIIVTLTFILISRLFLLQVIRHDYYTDLSQGNRIRNEPIPAERGLILDRNGEVIASNQPTYQLEMVPEEVPDVPDSARAASAPVVAERWPSSWTGLSVETKETSELAASVRTLPAGMSTARTAKFW